MRSVLDTADIENIADMVAHRLLKELSAHQNKRSLDGEYLTVEELALCIKVSKKWIYERTHMKEIPHYKAGGKLLFKRHEIDKWLEKTRVREVIG